MKFPLLIAAFFLHFSSSYAQVSLGNTADDIGVALEVFIAIVVLLLCCTCAAVILIIVYCCGGCRGKSNDTIPYQGNSDGTEINMAPTFAVSAINPKGNIQKEKKLLSSTANARTVSPDDLPNDLPAMEKSTLSRNDELEALETASSLLKKKGPEAVSKVALPQGKSRKERGMSWGRLDKDAQERVRSVKLLAATGGLVPIMPVYNDEASDVSANTGLSSGKRRLYSTKYTEPPVPTAATREKDPDAIRKKVARIAQGAGGGVYNTGSSTARLSMDIVKGFDLMREKKKMEAEQAEKKRLEKLGNQPQQAPKPVVKPPPPKEHETLPEGKQKLNAFLNDLDDDEF